MSKKNDEAGYRKDIADPLWIRRLRDAAKDGSVAELRKLEKELSSAIGRLEGYISGRHAVLDIESIRHAAEQERRSGKVRGPWSR